MMLTPQAHQLDLVTRNVRDFGWSGAGIVNPWNH